MSHLRTRLRSSKIIILEFMSCVIPLCMLNSLCALISCRVYKKCNVLFMSMGSEEPKVSSSFP